MQIHLEGCYLYGFDRQRAFGLDIWPKTPQQAKSIESIMKTTWNTEAMWQQKGSEKPNCLLVSTGKEARYVYAFLFCD